MLDKYPMDGAVKPTLPGAEDCSEGVRSTGSAPWRPRAFLLRHRREVAWYAGWVAVVLGLIMILSNFSGDAHAQPAADITVQAAPLTVAVGQVATLSVTLSGGLVVSPVGGSFSGYQLWWFYGSTNATGSIGYVYQHVPAPAGCTSSVPCDEPVTVTVSHVYETPGSYDTSFTVYDAQGNYRISTDVVTVVPAAVVVSAHSTVSQTTVDQPVGFEATAQVTPTPYANDQVTYEWLFGDNNSSYGDPVSHVFTQAGNYVVRVVATDNRTGAANQTFLDVAVTDPAPQAVITGATGGVEDSPVELSGFASVAPYSDHPFLRYRWNFGNGERGAGANTTTVYTQAGTYTVTLTVTNPLGESSVATRVLTIGDPLPHANAGSGVTVPVGQMAFLNASNSTDVPTDTPFLNYTWQTLNYAEGSSNGVIGRQDYFSPGTMNVELTLRSDTGQQVYGGTQVNVQDVAPTVGVYQIYQKVNVSLLVNSAYAPYYQLHLLEWNRTIATGRLYDFPPFATFLIPFAQINISVPYLFQVIYTGPPQPETIANPAMLEVQYDHGGNVQVPVIFTPTESEVWGASANALGLGQPLFLTAAAFSPAQTGLTTTWDFGDGTSVTQTTPAPAQPEPTYQTLSLVHTWAPGKDYTLQVTTRDAYGLTGQDTIQIQEVGYLSTSDLAPSITFPAEPTTTQELATSLSAEITDSNIFYSQLTTRWVFGDGATAVTEGGSSGVQAATNLSTVSHVYTYGRATYAVVVYASSPGGSTTANWFFLPVLDPAPVPVFTTTPGTQYEGTPVGLNATASTVAGSVHTGLVYGWDFGDGPANVGNWGAGGTLTYVYTREGVFPVTLTVTNPEGTSSTLVQYVGVVDAPLAASLSNRTVVVDQTVGFHPFALGTFPPDVATLRGSWQWGDGTRSTGLNVTHMYGLPGTYYVLLTLTDEDGNQVAVGATIRVVDSVPLVSLPYGGYTTYGENHTATFRATTLGSLADELYGGNTFQYQWTFGDLTPGVTQTGGVTDTVGHVYAVEGNPVLQVNVTTPFGATGSANVSLLSVPDSDGDGIPNLYAQAVMHISPYNPDVSGSGLTNFVKYFVLGGNATNADTLGAGLTDFQQVFGTVTGYVSNPMDPNQAGLPLKNGQFLFSQSYQSSTVTPVSTAGPSSISIGSGPIYYPGNPISFNSSELVVEITTSDLSAISLSLVLYGTFGLNNAAFETIPLPHPTSSVMSYYLLNNTPLGGPTSAYGIGMNYITSPLTYTLSVSNDNRNDSAVLQMAEVVNSYYTNPALADPTASGMILGNTLTTPVFNCSEPTNANFTEFDPNTFTYSTVNYYPYTETYYKLSVIQGVPYYASTNNTLASENGCLGSAAVSSQNTGAQATYYGDNDWGISPLDPHAAGDPLLTNGMKALGTTNYQATANLYLSAEESGLMLPSQDQRYAQDTYTSYLGPLNPTLPSTGSNGIYDSQSSSPTQYLVGEITIKSVFDGACSSGTSNQANVEIQDYGASGGPATIYTPTAVGQGSSSCAAGTGQQDTGYNFGDSYTFPLNLQNTYPFQAPNKAYYQNYVVLQLWFYKRSTSGSDTDLKLWFNAGQPEQGIFSGSYKGGAGGIWTIFVNTVDLPRSNVLLISQKNETVNIPGYGLRYIGEQRFYAFELYAPTQATYGSYTLEPGLNTILESRSAFLQSRLNESFIQRTYPSCIGDLTASTRGSGSSQSDFVAGFNGTASDGCIAQVISDLTPVNNTTGRPDGNVVQLTPLQFELSGLPQSLGPFTPVNGYDSPQTGSKEPNLSEYLNNIFLKIVQAVFNFFVGIVMAVVNFFTQLVQAIGQAIVGAITAAINAVISAINAVISALEYLLNFLDQFIHEIIQKAEAFFSSLFDKIVTAVQRPFLSLMYDAGLLNITQFNAAMEKFSNDPTTPLANSTAVQDVELGINVFVGVVSAIFAVVGVISYVAAVFTAGASEATEQASSASIQAAIGAIMAGLIAGASAIFSVFGAILQILPEIFTGGAVGSTVQSMLNDTGLPVAATADATSLLSLFITPFLALLRGAFVSFDFIMGTVLFVISAVFVGLSFVPQIVSSPLAQLVMAAASLLFSVIGLIIIIAGPSDVINDVANTQLAQFAAIGGGIAVVGVGIASLVASVHACTTNVNSGCY